MSRQWPFEDWKAVDCVGTGNPPRVRGSPASQLIEARLTAADMTCTWDAQQLLLVARGS